MLLKCLHSNIRRKLRYVSKIYIRKYFFAPLRVQALACLLGIQSTSQSLNSERKRAGSFGSRPFGSVDGEELFLPDKVNVCECITDVYNTR